VEGERIDMPGCGLGAYVVLLAVICVIGMSGLAISSYSLLKYSQAPASPLVPGNQVPVNRLAPLRKAGVLGLTDVPPAWHDESPSRDGTTVCALMPDDLVRLENGTLTRIRYDELATVQMEGTESTGGAVVATAKDGRVIRCLFGIEEGVTRFDRQLRSEAHLPVPAEF
jgi:hypothetical protein